MARFLSLDEAIATYVSDAQTVALEGFTHLIPFAAGHEIIRQGRRELTLIRMTPDLIYDQMIGAGCARKLVFSWGGNPGVGSLYRLRDAVERGTLEIEEHSHAAMASMWAAGASGLPFAVLRAYQGTSYTQINDSIRTVECPFTKETLAAVRAHRPDVGIVHAQRADAAGNVLIEGIVGVQKEVVLASAVSIVTVEEIVEELNAPSPNSVVIPSWAIDAVVRAPRGAHPSYTHGYYERDNAYYTEWSAISRDPDRFAAWLSQTIAGGTHA